MPYTSIIWAEERCESMYPIEVGARIAAKRQEKGLTQKQLAELVYGQSCEQVGARKKLPGAYHNTTFIDRA